ncbi:hypothetical protein D3C80_1573570 [compost metagenome]
MIVKGERDQRVVHPISRNHTPDGGPEGIEVPLTHPFGRQPLHLYPLTILRIVEDGTNGLNAQDRNSAPSIVERQPMFTRIGRLDGNPFSGAHRANQSHFLVARFTDLPKPLRKKTFALVVGASKAGTHKPSRTHCTVTGDHPRPLVILSDVAVGFLK